MIDDFRVEEKYTKPFVRILAIALCLLFSILITLVPHLSLDDRPIAVDTLYYVNWIRELDSKENFIDSLYYVFTDANSGTRPLSIILMFMLTRPYLDADLPGFIELVIPAILSPLLAITVYFLTREITRNDWAAFFSCFITAVSFQVIIGIYAGFYANWISLIFGYLCLAFLARGLRNPTKWNFLFFTTFLIFAMVAHVYTYSIIVFFLTIFFASLLFLKLYPRRIIVIFVIITGCTIAVDTVRGLNNPSFAGIEGDLAALERTGSGFSQFDYRWDNLVRTVQVFLGGGFSNILILVLAFYASQVLYYRTNYYLFIAIFLSLAIIPLFVANKDLMSRVLFNIPFQIPVAFSLLWIRNYSMNYKIFIIPCLFVSLTAIAIYMLSNF